MRPGFVRRERRNPVRHRAVASAHERARHLAHRPHRNSQKAPGGVTGAARTFCQSLDRAAHDPVPLAPSCDHRLSAHVAPYASSPRLSTSKTAWRKCPNRATEQNRPHSPVCGDPFLLVGVPRLRSRPTLAATQPPRSAALGIAMVDRAKLPDAVKKLSKPSASSNKATTGRNSGSALPAPEESGLATDRTGVLCDSPHGAKTIAENAARKAPDYSPALPRHPAVPLPRLANKTFNILSRSTPSPTPTPFQTPQHQLPHPGKRIKVKNVPTILHLTHLVL